MDVIQTAQLLQIAKSLSDIRDSFVMISLALTDLVTEMPSRERDAVLAAVERYLDRLRRPDQRDLDSA